MRRRNFITTLTLGLATSLAGCNTPKTSPNTTEANKVSTPTEMSDQEPTDSQPTESKPTPQTYYLSGFTIQDENAPFSYQATRVTEPNMPLGFDITVTNTTETTLTLGDIQEMFFELVASTEDTAYKLYPPLGDNQFSAEGGCWTVTDFHGQDSTFNRIQLGAGESETQRVYLATTPTETCSNQQLLTFETTIAYGTATFEPRTSTTVKMNLFYRQPIK